MDSSFLNLSSQVPLILIIDYEICDGVVVGNYTAGSQA